MSFRFRLRSMLAFTAVVAIVLSLALELAVWRPQRRIRESLILRHEGLARRCSRYLEPPVSDFLDLELRRKLEALVSRHKRRADELRTAGFFNPFVARGEDESFLRESYRAQWEAGEAEIQATRSF